jgi:hypothetical protein
MRIKVTNEVVIEDVIIANYEMTAIFTFRNLHTSQIYTQKFSIECLEHFGIFNFSKLAEIMSSPEKD